MAERKKRTNRRRVRKPSTFESLFDVGCQAFGVTAPKLPPISQAKPETMFMYSVGAAVLNFAFNKFFPHLAIQAPQARPHPEKAEPITSKFDEYQAGRSAVIREVARPKNN